MPGNSMHEEETLGKGYDSRLTRRLGRYVAPYKRQVVLALVCIMAKAGADVVGPYLTKVAVDRYMVPGGGGGGAGTQAHAHSGFTGWLSPNPLTGMGQIAALYVASLVAVFLLEFTQTYFMQWTGQRLMFDLRSQIFRHLQRMHIAFFDRNPVGRLITRVTNDVDVLNEMFTAGVVAVFDDFFVLLGIVVIMLRMNWQLALITIAVLPVIFGATITFRRNVREPYRRIRTAIARINAYLHEHISGMTVVQLYNGEDRAYQRFEQVNATHMEAFKAAILAHAVYYPVVEILAAVAIALALWFGGNQVLAGVTTLGVLVAFMQYAQRFFRPIQDLSEKYNVLQSAMAASERIFQLLDTPPDVVSPANSKSPTGPGRIEFDHVWFAYPRLPAPDAAGDGPQPEWVLRDVSFAIEPGKTVAIVGHTGAGKTTIVSLLLRFYDVLRGAVRIDGIDVREMDLTQLRRRFGVALQDPFLFAGTVMDNIRLGSTWITDEAVERAAEDVHIADFIRHLPDGFRGEVRERGTTLSTGQKQLISFARALAHDPKILILDEATSSVDTETEFRVRDALARMVRGRTSLIIAHRLSTIQRADQILVMHKGSLRETGNHGQLLALRGIYWRLYQLQYKDQDP